MSYQDNATSNTKGPWKYRGENEVYDIDDNLIAKCDPRRHEYRANARLIAAAPDLIEILEFLFQSVASGNKHSDGALLLHVSPDYIETCQGILKRARGTE